MINSERINYFCNSCGYEFTRKKDRSVARCPYCSKDSVEIKKGQYASKILDEVSGF